MNTAYPKPESTSHLSTLLVEDYATMVHAIDDTDLLIEFALDQMFELVGAHAGSFFLWDEFKKGLVLKRAKGPYESRQRAHPHIKLRQGISGLVGEQGKGVLVKDIDEDHRFQAVKRNPHYRSNSFISLPLIAHNKLVGVINITEKKSLEAFNELDMRRAQNFARHIAIALENLRLVQRLERENDELYHKVGNLTHKVKEQETLCAVGKLSANLAHELNNPLDAIRRYVNLAFEQTQQESLSREYLFKAKKGIRRSIRVIRGLLQYSKEIHQSESRTTEVHALVTQSLESVIHDAQFENIEIFRDYSSETLYINDCGIAVVLENLFRNASHAMQGIGKIRVATEKRGKGAVISVEDTGTGIAEADLKRVFEPFYSTKSNGEGTGIGLTLCQEIVQKSGGQIECSNTEHGAKFLITLPCVDRG